MLKSQAHVVGDIHHQSLAMEKGAYFEGSSIQAHGANGQQPDRVAKRHLEKWPIVRRQPDPFGNLFAPMSANGT